MKKPKKPDKRPLYARLLPPKLEKKPKKTAKKDRQGPNRPKKTGEKYPERHRVKKPKRKERKMNTTATKTTEVTKGGTPPPVAYDEYGNPISKTGDKQVAAPLPFFSARTDLKFQSPYGKGAYEKTLAAYKGQEGASAVVVAALETAILHADDPAVPTPMKSGGA